MENVYNQKYNQNGNGFITFHAFCLLYSVWTRVKFFLLQITLHFIKGLLETKQALFRNSIFRKYQKYLLRFGKKLHVQEGISCAVRYFPKEENIFLTKALIILYPINCGIVESWRVSTLQSCFEEVWILHGKYSIFFLFYFLGSHKWITF